MTMPSTVSNNKYQQQVYSPALKPAVPVKDKTSLAASKLLSVQEAPDVTPPSSYTGRVFSWMANTRMSVWASVQILKHTRFWLMIGGPSERTRDAVTDSLKRNTGSDNLSEWLHVVSPQLGKLLQRQLIELNLYEGLNRFLQREHCNLQQLLDVLLHSVFNNIANYIRARQGKDKEVALVDVVDFLCTLVNKHSSYINKSLNECNRITDPDKRDRKLIRLFTPLTQEFLSIALPGGANELPFTHIPMVTNYLWNNLQSAIFPRLFASLYKTFADPLTHHRIEALLEHTGGESLVSLAALASTKTAELIPNLFIEQISQKNDQQLQPSPLSVDIAAKLASLVGTPKDRTEALQLWLANQFAKLSQKTTKQVSSVWKLGGSYVESLLLYVFSTLVGKPTPEEKLTGKTPDAIGIIMIRLFSVCTRFINAFGDDIDRRLAQLTAARQPIKSNDELLRIFQKLADDLLHMTGLDNPKAYPIPRFLRSPLHNYIVSNASKVLLRQYLALRDTDFHDEDLDRKLRSFLFDPKNLSKPGVVIPLVTDIHQNQNAYAADMFHRYYEALWEVSGTDRVAKTIEAMCTVCAQEIVSAISRMFGIAAQKAFNPTINPSSAKFNSWLTKWCERSVKEMVVNILQSTPDHVQQQKQSYPQKCKPVDVIIEFTGIIMKHMRSSNTWKSKSEAEAAFHKMAVELQAYAGFNPITLLPLVTVPAEEQVKEALWDSVTSFLLPQVLQNYHREMTSWEKNVEQSYQTLDECFHTTHPQWACKVMAQYATDFVKHYLAHSNDEAAVLLLDSMKDYFQSTKSQAGEDAAKLLSASHEEVQSLLRENIKDAGTTTDCLFNESWPALNAYFEAMIAKFFAEFSRSINNIENDHPDFMVDTAIEFLKTTSEHFSIISGTTEELGLAHVYEVDPKAMIVAFGDKLHDGVPLDPDAPEKDKDLARLKGCFIPMAEKFLQLADIEIADFPLPTPIKTLAGKLFVDKILPLCLMKAFQKGTEPQFRDAMMLNFVQTLYAALNKLPQHAKQTSLPEAVVRPDSKQKHLYETCGSLVLELVKLIPDTTVQYVFMKERVKEMSAEAIGDAMMPYLSKLTLLQMIDSMIYAGLPSLHPSKWEGKLGREVLSPRKVSVRPDGKMELKPSTQFKFEFSDDPLQAAQKEANEREETEQVRSQLRNAFTRTISQQLSTKIWTVTKSLWTFFQGTIRDFIEQRFGEKGVAFKAHLDRIFHRIFFDVIGNVFVFLSTPFINGIKYIIEKTLIDHRSEAVILDLEAEIMENLFYKWADTIFDSLLKLKTAHP